MSRFRDPNDPYDPDLNEPTPGGPDEFPDYKTDWDRLLNVYTIQELPILPADHEPGHDEIPVALKVLREIFLDAADSHALEVWFDYAPGREGVVDACYTPTGKGTSVIRIPESLFYDCADELGIFGFLYRELSDDGMFAIHVNHFRDRPVDNPFDKRGRIVQPVLPPDHKEYEQQPGSVEFPLRDTMESVPDTSEESKIPGITEVAIIRAYRISLKGRSIPEDLVIQICPRFWHMPTGFTVG